MSEMFKPQEKSPFQNLDSAALTLPGRSLESIVGLFAHLESLAARRTKGFTANSSGENAVRELPELQKHPAAEDGISDRISLRDLGHRVIRTARCQLACLRARTAEIQELVLINRWEIADQLWSGLLLDCRTPLFELSFLEELWGIPASQFEAGGWPLVRHWEQFILIQSEIEFLLARRQSLVELSDALEWHLAPWLERFDGILGKLNEQSLA